MRNYCRRFWKAGLTPISISPNCAGCFVVLALRSASVAVTISLEERGLKNESICRRTTAKQRYTKFARCVL